MIQLDAPIPDPRGLSFTSWALLLTEALAEYNVPAPVQDAWFDWASALFAAPDLVELGLPNPAGFADWVEWAEQLVQTLYSS